ncbi:MAG: histidine phosphatase family protein [Oscillospiraceae bacterium]|nr:histidine phosphatase family protein [Oscillospiraceae bacterium]
MNYERSCGFVVYRLRGGVREYLVIESLNGDVGFPKGHMEGGETELETARRELKEETNLDAEYVAGYRKMVEYPLPKKPGTIKQSVYFIGKYASGELRRQESEVLRCLFLPYGEAHEQLTFDSAKEILREVDAFLARENGEAPLTTVYFVRHAEPNYENHDDAARELSEKGLRDRALVTAFLQSRKIDAVLSSPYKRAVDTVSDFAEKNRLAVRLVDDFRERQVDDVWIDDFDAFCKRQWSDFSYKLAGGESLRDVQTRNIAALNRILPEYRGKTIAVGSHGTALSTIIHYYDERFGYDDFVRIKNLMPWIVEFVFDEAACKSIRTFDLFKP